MYHVNFQGEVGECTSTIRNCPYGGHHGHFATPEEARKNYEGRQKSQLPVSLNRATVNSTPNVEDLKRDLNGVYDMVVTYRDYRATGLDEPQYLPKVPAHLHPYMDAYKVDQAMRQQDFYFVIPEYVRALKAYYMREKFGPSDIDVLPDDDYLMSCAEQRVR